MRQYLEINEIVTEAEEVAGQPCALRLPVESEQEAEDMRKVFNDFFLTVRYDARVHKCYHEDGKPCELVPLGVHEVEKLPEGFAEIPKLTLWARLKESVSSVFRREPVKEEQEVLRWRNE